MLRKYVRQLNPIQDRYVAPVLKIQSLKEASDSEVESIIKSIGGGKMSEAVFEAWAYIVAKTSGNKTLPTIKDIQSAMSEKEFDIKGKEWITDFLSKTKDITFLFQAIELIGGDMKKIPNVNWGNVQVLHRSIDQYYKNTPKKYAEGAKANTADIVLITKGTVDSLLKALPNSDMSWGNDGKVSIDGTDIEFIQVSLKKGEEKARIGKLSSLINQIYGQQAMRPAQLVGEDIQQLEEGLSDIFGKAVGLIKLGATKLLSFTKNMLLKLKNSLLKSAIKITKTITKDKAHKSAANISKILGGNLSENFIMEKAPLPPVTINAPLLKEMKILKTEIIAKDLANKEYAQMLKNVDAINSKKDGAIKVINKGTNPILEMNYFKGSANNVLSKKIGDTITREDLNPALKLVVNYASYRTFNVILLDMLKNIQSYNTITDSLVGLNAKLRAEAMFGKTSLPLWIVYGMGGGAQYKHTKDEFESSTKEDIIKLGESMDVPYMFISIAKSSKNPTYNAIYAYILVGSVKENDTLQPEYLMLQFINRSGSDWSYKIDASSSKVGRPDV